MIFGTYLLVVITISAAGLNENKGLRIANLGIIERLGASVSKIFTMCDQ